MNWKRLEWLRWYVHVCAHVYTCAVSSSKTVVMVTGILAPFCSLRKLYSLLYFPFFAPS